MNNLPWPVVQRALAIFQAYENYGVNCWSYRADNTKSLHFDSILIQSFCEFSGIRKKKNNRLAALKAVIKKNSQRAG